MKQLLFLFLFFSISISAQNTLNGIVKDVDSNKPIPYVTIAFSSGEKLFTDVNGKFNFSYSDNNLPIHFIRSGYTKKTITHSVQFEKTIYLDPLSKEKRQAAELFSIENAEKIIAKVFQNKNKNNPQKAISRFEFKSYNKVTITANPDSIVGRIDSVYNPKKNKFKIDSSDYKFKKIIEKQHLFQTEKISQFQWEKNFFKETVVGSKMSGFKEPIYEVIGLKLETYNLYDDKYDLLESKYVSPISKIGLSDYTFQLIDSISVNNRPSYVLFFKNKKKINRKGLEGILFIDQENYAISKAIFRIRGILDLTSIHDYEFNDAKKLWFPSTTEIKIVKGKNDDPIKVLGGTIIFEGEYKNTELTRPKYASDFTYLDSKTSYFDLNFEPTSSLNNKTFTIEVLESAIKKDESFWDNYRKENLSFRDKNTYASLDSISMQRGIESKILFGRKIINGYLPVGPIDFDLKYLLSYNNYEGFRLGIGGKTNDRFSKKFRLEGYTAYGLKDETIKYQLGAATRIGNYSNSWIGASYTDDVSEIGSTKFNIDKRVFKIYDPRPINVSTFYNHQTWKGFVETKILPKTESIWQLNRSHVTPLFDYVFNLNGNLYTNYTMTTASVSMQWNPFSDFMHTPKGNFEVEKRFPKFTFQWTQSMPDVFENDFSFGKIDIRADYEKKYLNGQKTSLLAQAGYAYGDVPLTHLYNNQPNNLDRDRLLQRVTVAGKNSFETMYFNEFFSNRYVMLHFKHGFKRIELFKKVKPALVMVTRMAWGEMEKPEQHIGLNYKTLNDGFFESGIELNQIYKGLGLAGFYRYGPNQLSRFEDNIALKITFSLDLGI
ncbi:DUF5686 family protein [Flavobacterium orientale]|uniref:CarboxypepD_reg-like domain-containing protein n=1 Tax=Flavobacterium orientale TaxID=1756020 RepID=A0A916XXG8_9FLAO|nr:DUF5686 family protein [Flavobacterium orientale]GGD19072.1 hypothetical protein GCM10011343_07050 [Flavobacterium orientale]